MTKGKLLKNIALAIGIGSLLSNSILAQNTKELPLLYRNADQKKLNHWVDSVYNTLDTDQKVGQLFSIIIAGNTTASNKTRLKDLIEKQHIGGILFSKISIQDHAEMTNYAQSLAQVPLLISLDGEWGLGMRIEDTTPWPRNMMLGAIQNDSLLFYYGEEVARQCKQLKIHVNFAPVMDVNSNPNNPVIGYRSFGENPKRVGELGVLYSKGLESVGVMSVAKHFPGHGDTSTDSHHTLPLINHKLERLNNYELVPFKTYIKEGLSGMMIGHLNVPALGTNGHPSSLSESVVTKLLKNELNFNGLVFTDGMQMKGVAMEANHSLKALLAGNDVVLSPTYPAKEFNSVKDAVTDGTLSEKVLEEKVKRILAYKYILGATSQANTLVDTTDLEPRLNTGYANWLNRKLHENAITLVKDEKDIIPLNKLDKRKVAAVSIGAPAKNSFLDMLKMYGDVDTYSVADASMLSKLKGELDKYNTIIISVHNRKESNNAGIIDIMKGKESILAFFIAPYYMSRLIPSMEEADGVIIGYEDTNLANEFTAQALFGGTELRGRLPVSIGTLFKDGTGVNKKKSRLAYGIPEDVGILSHDLDSIAFIVQEGIDNEAFPGAQVLIAKDGVIIYNEAFGKFQYEDSKEVSVSDIYDLASMTKATATVPALMKLHDQHLLKLSDPLSKFVEPLKNTSKDQITVRDALLHETGIVSFIPYYVKAIDKTSYKGTLFSRTYQEPFTAKFDDRTYARTDYKFKPQFVSTTPKENFQPIAKDLYVSRAYTDSIVQEIADTKLRSQSNYLYSCLNFILLKEVVENISKEDMNDFLDENFYKKLGAVTTTYRPLEKFPKERIVPTENDEFLRKQLLQGYPHDEGAAFMGGVSGNAGLFSDANDLAKLYQMWLYKGEYGGERYLSENTVFLFTKGKSAKSRRGLGFDKPEAKSGKGPCSASTPLSTYGHTGYTGTAFWVDPDNNLIYIFLSNRVYPNRSHGQLSKLQIRSRIQEEIYKAIRKSKANEKVS